MSNSLRIWIGYAFLPLMFLAVLGPVIVVTMLRASDDAVIPATLLTMTIYFASYVGYWRSKLAKCWRCAAPLNRTASGWYGPFVLWKHCVQCRVRHAARPEEARANPMANLRRR